MTVIAMVNKPIKRRHELEVITPERALELLELNTLNRPLDQRHIERIATQIKTGKWQFNGDTIKISGDGNIVDGQHRLWAIVEAKKPVETLVVHDVPREAFATIDTISKPRGGADILALNGVKGYRQITAAALVWLVRWQRKPPTLTGPGRRVEVSEIEQAYGHHSHISEAAERVNKSCRGICSPSLMTFLYYMLSSRDAEIGERFMTTMDNPSGLSASDPFFRFRGWVVQNSGKHISPIVVIAMAIKAANAAKAGRKIETLSWKHQGNNPEVFPELSF